VILGFRPEDLEDASLAGGAASGASLSVVPEIREDVGAEVYVHFGLGVPPVRRTEVAEAQQPDDPAQARIAARSSSPFVARLGRGTRAREGEPLELTVDVERLYLFDAETGEGLDA
jgi:multiple sugar transport system ATP-binding protein